MSEHFKNDWSTEAHHYLGHDHPAHLGVSCMRYQEGERPQTDPRVQTIALDFDGVIHAYSKGWHDGTIYDEPMLGAIEGLKKLQERYAVFVFTVRDALSVCHWLERHDVPATVDTPPNNVLKFWSSQSVVLVTERKLPAVAYVDDRGVRFTSWDSVLHQLEHLT